LAFVVLALLSMLAAHPAIQLHGSHIGRGWVYLAVDGLGDHEAGAVAGNAAGTPNPVPV